MPFLPNVFPWLLSLLCRLFLAILADYYLSSIIKSKIYVCVREKKEQKIEFSEIGKTTHFETMFSLFDNTGLHLNELGLLQAFHEHINEWH